LILCIHSETAVCSHSPTSTLLQSYLLLLLCPGRCCDVRCDPCWGCIVIASHPCRSCTVTAGAVLAAGASNTGSNSSSESERPTYTHVAALQELALVLVPADGQMQLFNADDIGERRRRRHTLSADGSSSSNNSSSSTASRGQPGGTNATANSSDGSILAPGQHDNAPNHSIAGQAAAPVAGNSSEAGCSSSTLDLDPPFRPLVDRYFALLPPGPSVGQLLLSSSRWGDVVVVDTTACSELESARCEPYNKDSMLRSAGLLQWYDRQCHWSSNSGLDAAAVECKQGKWCPCRHCLKSVWCVPQS
jgi:hypothetical protein